MKAKLAGALVALALAGFGGPAAATVLDPLETLRADFAPVAPYDSFMFETGYGAFTGEYPGPGDSFRVSVYDGSQTLLFTQTVTPTFLAYSQFHVSAAPASLYVVLDQITGVFEMHRINFFPRVNGQFDYPSSLSAGAGTENPFVLTAVPEPSTYALLFAGLAVLGGLVRRRSA